MINKLKIEAAVKDFLCAIGEDPEREGLIETPRRVANMCEEIFAGLHTDPADNIKLFCEHNSGDTIFVKDISFHSICEHHLLPFFGKINIAYSPKNDRILGLSKFARIVDSFSRKPQLQERLGNELADFILRTTECDGVAVYIEAEHLCMTMRGIKRNGSKTLTTVIKGDLKKDSNWRKETLASLRS